MFIETWSPYEIPCYKIISILSIWSLKRNVDVDQKYQKQKQIECNCVWILV
jgi:hypothetical protein